MYGCKLYDFFTLKPVATVPVGGLWVTDEHELPTCTVRQPCTVASCLFVDESFLWILMVGMTPPATARLTHVIKDSGERTLTRLRGEGAASK